MNKVPLRLFRSPAPDVLPIEIARMQDLPQIAWRPQAHRQAFYSLFWVQSGAGSHHRDFVGDDVQPGSLHFVGPGQVHYWELTQSLTGYVAIISPEFELELDVLAQVNFFRTINGVSMINPAAEEAAWFDAAFAALHTEYRSNSFGRTPSIVAWLQLILVRAQRLAEPATDPQTTVTAEQQLAYRYTELVEQYAIQHHKVDWYAAELAVTVGHLSKSIKSALGTTAGDLLRHRIVLEAKRLLVHTSDPVADIARQLNFEDPSYFGRFFKREATVTPRVFRTQFPTKYQNAPSD